jgi:glycosyltransferase involved in cell wall biosynthesis
MPHLERLGVEFCFDESISRTLYQVLYRPGPLNTLKKSVYLLSDTLRRAMRAPWAGPFDLVFLHREAALIGPAWMERQIARSGVPMVFDFDDSIYRRSPASVNGVFARLKFSGKTATICRLADHVVVGNRVLEDYARKYCPRVTVIPTTVDTERFTRHDGGAPKRAPVIGWTGSHTTVGYLDMLRPALQELARTHEFVFRVIGVDGFAIEGVNVVCAPWRPDTEVDDLSLIDIGVMPLPDDEWTRGKCALKVLQYMALGIPTVASPVGVNADIINDGVNGFLAADRAQWVERLSRLLESRELRRETGLRGCSTVSSWYTARIQAPRLMEVFTSTLDARRSEGASAVVLTGATGS